MSPFGYAVRLIKGHRHGYVVPTFYKTRAVADAKAAAGFYEVIPLYKAKTVFASVPEVWAAMLAAAPTPPTDGWRAIEPNADYGFPILVARPAYSADQFGPVTAFKDVTGVWRIYLSEGGSDPVPFEPTHWMERPAPPQQQREES